MLTYLTINHGLGAYVATYCILFGLGMGIPYSVIFQVASSWFPAHRATVVGIIASGFGLGALVFTPIQTRIINPYDVQPVAGKGYTKSEAVAVQQESLTVTEAIKCVDFYILFGVVFCDVIPVSLLTSTFKCPLLWLLLQWGLLFVTYPYVAAGSAGPYLYALWIFAIFFTLSGHFVIIPGACTRIFGPQNMATIYGLVYAATVSQGHYIYKQQVVDSSASTYGVGVWPFRSHQSSYVMFFCLSYKPPSYSPGSRVSPRQNGTSESCNRSVSAYLP
ncbi:unnamed protein product [Schistocephalus solidus]|uniref:Oxalate:formate antiporter n=1 Tax=Schistocephalus solidus TaxID=70667 RepID=A0A183T9Z7_SCHSO|nr:unnamed protein product [Schistocephalus solidus]